MAKKATELRPELSESWIALGFVYDAQGDITKAINYYKKAIELDADIIVMLHPDYQYTPKLIPAMCELIANGTYDLVLGSRILGNGALEGGMPIYKYISNRILTFIQNLLMNQKLSEYHTGYRCYDSSFLKKIDLKNNSNDFVFDN